MKHFALFCAIVVAVIATAATRPDPEPEPREGPFNLCDPDTAELVYYHKPGYWDGGYLYNVTKYKAGTGAVVLATFSDCGDLCKNDWNTTFDGTPTLKPKATFQCQAFYFDRKTKACYLIATPSSQLTLRKARYSYAGFLECPEPDTSSWQDNITPLP